MYGHSRNRQQEAERSQILQTLQQTEGLIGGRNDAAARLGLPRTTLIHKMKRLGITVASVPPSESVPRIPYTRIMGEGLSALSVLSLYADHLAQRVNHVHQIALRFHHRVNGLVRHRRFVDNVRILTALDARSCLGVIVQGEAALGFRARHGAPGSMTAVHETLRIALAAHDVRTRSHAAGNNSHVSLTPTDCAFARDEHVLAVVVLPSHTFLIPPHYFHIASP